MVRIMIYFNLLHNNVFSFISSFITKVAKKNSRLLLFKTESLDDMQKIAQITTVLEEILLDLYHHLARVVWLIQEYLFSVKKESGPTLKIQQR